MPRDQRREGFPSLGIGYVYTGHGSRLLSEFLLPLLGAASEYDRVTSYYTLDSLIAISAGVERLYARGGRMRLIVGIHSVPGELAAAADPTEPLRAEAERIGREIGEGILGLSDAIQRERLATLAWMIADGLLEVRAAAVDDGGLFHTKLFLLRDAQGNSVIASGSANETRSGLGGNYETIMVQKSWETPGVEKVWRGVFEGLWEGSAEGVTSCEITQSFASAIERGLGGSVTRPGASHAAGAEGAIAAARRMPSYFFVSGDIPGLYQHQERAVIDALSRWPVRVLLSDEVGLGKTFEAAAAMAFMVRFCGVRSVVILTPKSVLSQWQSELRDRFGIEAWLYDSTRGLYVGADGTERPQAGNPLGAGRPDIALVSAQYARGSRGRPGCLERGDAVLPDLLVVDEAHAARVSTQAGGRKKTTRLYAMLESVCAQIPHVILATATPMQKEASEYHALLRLLGLPRRWGKESRFLGSLETIASSAAPDLTSAAESAKLLLSTLDEMRPDLSELGPASRASVAALAGIDRADSIALADYVQRNWGAVREALTMLHPAHLLTVRNTRRSLEGVGYRFPRRNLHAVSLDGQREVMSFYGRVDAYISNEYFSIEEAMRPGRRNSTGFTRVGYQQRISSSLCSCYRSLKRRLAKLNSIRADLSGTAAPDWGILADLGLDLDPDDDSDLFEDGDAASADIPGDLDGLSAANVAATASIEAAAVRPLIEEAEGLIGRGLDMKVKKSVDIALESLAAGDRVLLFSRYTDTVDALAGEFRGREDSDAYTYGIYSGSASEIHRGDDVRACAKTEITDALRRGDLRLLICSDAASEGLNLQAARVLVNVDVPWTPSVLEQRIGRVARLGQRAAEVDIYNVWYPRSVEQRMYTRIQERFHTANLAVGEFPDVVATEIRDAILSGSPSIDEGMESLLELRNSAQTRALERLFAGGGEPGETASDSIRSALMDAAESSFAHTDLGAGRMSFSLAGGGEVELTAEVGCDQTVSLSSAPWRERDFGTDGLAVIEDPDGRPAAFSSAVDPSRPLDNAVLTDILVGRDLVARAGDGKRPETLPDPSALSMAFACGECPPRPEFWNHEATEGEI